jgi:hypothetical protein
LVLLFLE